MGSPGEFIARGWDECLIVLDRLDAALALPDGGEDPCLRTEAGWIAEEAMATPLLCALRQAPGTGRRTRPGRDHRRRL